MLKHGQGSHIVTTSSTDGVLLGTAGIYAVTKMAVSGLMEQLRHELRATNIGTSNLVPGQTTSNLGRSESEYRPEALKNEAPPTPRAPGARPPGAARPPAPETTPLWARPQTALTVGRLVVDGILNNDMWIYPAPEYIVGVQARGMAMAESMVPYQPMRSTSRQEGTATTGRRSTCRKSCTGAPRASATFRASRLSGQGAAGKARRACLR
jgi:hypothetical protein